MDIEIRRTGPEERRAIMEMLATSFGERLTDEEVERENLVLDEATELAAFDDGRVVGNTTSIPLELTVPGAVIASAAITSVGVLPTHRRRGILTALMRRQLDELHDAGHVIAELWASEAAIYGRFGYGMAIWTGALSIERPYTGFARRVEDPGRVRLVERSDAARLFAPVYDQVRPTTPGFLERTEAWWDYLFEGHDHGDGPKATYFVVHESPSGVDGYAYYRIKNAWATTPRSVLEVEDLMATTQEAYAALWRYVFDVDLIAKVATWKRPLDEPLLYMLVEPRRLNFNLRDGVFVRLIDVPGALALRRYATRDRIVLEVRDGFCPWNDGRYELMGERGGAECRPTDAEPDLVLDAVDLGAVYMGGVRMSTLARAGRVHEVSEGAAARSDAMFRWDVTPWTPHVF